MSKARASNPRGISAAARAPVAALMPGKNFSDADRTGVNITYCLGWLRTEENQYLSCPPEIAKSLDHDLQEMLGYTMGSYALGYYSDPSGVSEINDLRPPEFVLDRPPRDKASSAALIADY